MKKNRHIIERDTPFLRVMEDYVIPGLLIGAMALVGTICVSLACAQLGLDVLAVSGGR